MDGSNPDSAGTYNSDPFGNNSIRQRPSSIPKKAKKGAQEVVVGEQHLKKMQNNLEGLMIKIFKKDGGKQTKNLNL